MTSGRTWADLVSASDALRRILADAESGDLRLAGNDVAALRRAVGALDQAALSAATSKWGRRPAT